MSTEDIQLTWKREEHPPLELLRQYQEEALPADASYLVERHLLECDICTDVVEGLVLADQEQTKAAVHDLNSRLRAKLQPRRKKKPVHKFLWADWRMAAAILVLVCSIALVYFYQVSLLEEEQLEEVANTSNVEGEQEVKQTAPVPAPDSHAISPSSPMASATSAKSPAVAGGAEEAVVSSAGKKAAAPKLTSEQVAGLEMRNKIAAASPDAKQQSVLPATVFSDSTKPASSAIAGVLEERSSSASYNKPIPSESIPASENIVSKPSEAKGRQINGKVVSSDGQDLPGVSVLIKGAAMGTSTDAQGNFAIQVPVNKETLQFNYIGFEPKEVKLNEEIATLNVILEEDSQTLSEVAVVGYGTHRKASPDVASAPVTGMRSFKIYVKQNTRYPIAEAQAKTRGKVTLGFTVMPDGSIGNIKVLKSLSPAFDAEAIRLLKEGPAWRPATTKGTPVQQDVKVGIRFRKP